MFLRIVLLPYSRSKSHTSNQKEKELSLPPASCWYLLAYCLILKMEAVHSSKMSVNVYRITWCDIPEDSILMLLHINWIAASNIKYLLSRFSCCITEQIRVINFRWVQFNAARAILERQLHATSTNGNQSVRVNSLETRPHMVLYMKNMQFTPKNIPQSNIL
jgi:hypothetical protein